MNLSIKTIIARSLAALMLLSIPLTAQAGGFGGGGGARNNGGPRPSSSGFRPANNTFRSNGNASNGGSSFRSFHNTNVGGVARSSGFRSSNVQSSGFRGVVHNNNNSRTMTQQRVGSWRKAAPVVHNKPLTAWSAPRTGNWKQPVVMAHRHGTQTMHRPSRPVWLRSWTRGPIVWHTPFCRARSGRWIINSCVGITPFVAAGYAQVDSEQAQQYSGAEIKISCSPDMPGNVGYMLNGTEYDMQPGYSQRFAEDRTWVIQFRSGGENSEVVEFTLTAGEYQFVVVDGKLTLMPVGPEGVQPVGPEVQQVAPEGIQPAAPDAQEEVAPGAPENLVPDVTQQQFSPDGQPNVAPVAP